MQVRVLSGAPFPVLAINTNKKVTMNSNVFRESLDTLDTLEDQAAPAPPKFTDDQLADMLDRMTYLSGEKALDLPTGTTGYVMRALKKGVDPKWPQRAGKTPTPQQQEQWREFVQIARNLLEK